MGLTYTTTEEEDEVATIEEALRAAADERRGYVATPDPASSVAEAGTRAPALTAPRAPVAPPTFIPEPEPEREATPGPDAADLSTGMPEADRAFEEGMARYRTSNGRLPELPPDALALAEDPDAVMDDMTEDEILEYAAESDPYSTPEQDERTEEPVAKLPVGRPAIKGGAPTLAAPTPVTDSDSARVAAERGGAFPNTSDDAGPDWMEQPDVSGKPRRGTKGPLAAPEDPNAVAAPNFDSLEDDLMSGMAGTGLMPEAEADMEFSYPEATRSNALPAADMEFSEEDVAAAESPNFPGLPTADMEFAPEPDMEFAESALYPGLTDADMEFSTEEAFSAPPARANVNADMSFPGMEQGDGDAAFASTEGEQASPMDAWLADPDAADGPVDPEAMAEFDGERFVPSGIEEPLALGAAYTPDAYPAGDNEMAEASMGIDDDEVAELPGPPRPPGGMALADPRVPPEASGALETSGGAKVPTEPGSDPRALDYGLPTEGEIGNERGWDVLRQITGRLGNALRVAGGGSHRDIETVAPGMETARREGIEGRLSAKGASAEGDRRATRDAELAEGVARARREPTELELSREARIAADSERDDALTGRRIDLDERGLEGREGRAAETSAREAEMRDPASDVSGRARERLAIALEGLPPALQAEITSGHRLETMSAADVEALEDSIPAFARGMLGRGRGAAGGGGGGRSATQESLRNALMERNPNMSEAEADAYLASMGSRRVASSMLTDSLTRGRTEATADRRLEDRARGEALIEGVHATVPMSAPARRDWQRGWASTRGSTDAMRRIRAIADEYGAATVITPAVRARLEANMFPLRGMAAAVQGTGVINPTEMPAINAALPDATSMIGMTVGSFSAALEEWRGLVEEGIRHQMEDMGVPPDEVTRAIRALRAGGRIIPGGERPAPAEGAPEGSATTGAAPTGDTVRVRLGNGRTANLPRDVYEAHRDEVEVIDGP